MNKQTATFAARVWEIASDVGNSAPKITDVVMEETFPLTCMEARQEGAFKMLRTGIITEVKRILRDRDDGTAQRDFGDLCQQFAPLIKDLKSRTYFVQSAEEYVSVPDLIAEPDLLDDARRFMRTKGMECLAEADRLDALYAAVTDQDDDGDFHAPTVVPAPVALHTGEVAQ